MTKQDRRPRDAFTLSLGGMTTIASFATAPAIAHDQLQQKSQEQVRKRGSWTFRLFRTA